MSKDIQAIMDAARKPGKVNCPECGDELFSPMDKISIGLYGRCATHIEDQTQVDNLFELVGAL